MSSYIIMNQKNTIQKAVENGIEEEEGLIWDTYIIDDSVVQVPREGDEWRIERVRTIYNTLNDNVPAPKISSIENEGKYEGIVFERIQGDILRESSNSSPQENTNSKEKKQSCLDLIEETGRALAQIHNSKPEFEGFGYFTLEDGSVVSPHETWRDYAEEKLDDLDDIPERFEEAYQIAIDNFDIEKIPDNPERSLLHDDFHSGNIIVEKDGSIKVIDFDNAIIGDPNFGYINSKFEMCDYDDKEAQKRFQKGYEKVRDVNISDEVESNYVALAILDSISAGKWLAENRDVDFLDEYTEDLNNWAKCYFS